MARPASRGSAAADETAAPLELRGQRYVSRTHYALSLLVEPGERLAIRATFERRRLEDTAVARLLGHLATLLAGLAAEPAPPLASLPLLSAAERHQLLREWPDRPRPVPPLPAPQLLHAGFERQARAAPGAVALVDAETEIA